MNCAAADITPVAISARQARLLLLDGQGLLGQRVAATPATVNQFIQKMGFVQIDAINVIARAHHLILFGRMDGYQSSMLTDLLENQRTLFEHWTHDASAIPIEWFPHWHHRFKRDRRRIPRNEWWGARLGCNPRGILKS